MKNLLFFAMIFTSASAMAAGWNYNLTKKCAATTGAPGQTNYFEVRDQCPNATNLSLPPPKHWQLGVQTENQEIPGSIKGVACTGVDSRSEKINGSNSPVRLSWFPHTSDIGANWTVNLKIDRNA